MAAHNQGERISSRARAAEAAYYKRKGLDENGELLSTQTEIEDPKDDLQDDDLAPLETELGADEDVPAEEDDSHEGEEAGSENDRQQGIAPSDYELLKAKLEKAEQELSSMKGRVPMTQQQLVQERQANATLAAQLKETEERLAQLQAQKSQTSVAEAIRASLTDDDMATIGEEGVSVIQKAVLAATNALMPKSNPREEIEQVLRERDNQTVDQFRRETVSNDRWLNRLGELAQDSKFLDWLNENPEVDSALKDISTTQDRSRITRLANSISRRIGEYHGVTPQPKTESKKPSTPDATKEAVPNPAGSKARHMRRAPKETLTAEEANARLEEAKRLSRSKRPADLKRAEELINSIS